MMRQLLLYVFILFVGSVSAEQFKITGKVVDAEYNEPLIGTTVQIMGTDRYTTSDIDGNFSIEVEKGAILSFSCIGCKSKEVEVLNDSSLVIELENNPLDKVWDDIIKYRRDGPPAWMKDAIYRSIGEQDSLKTNPKNQNSVINH